MKLDFKLRLATLLESPNIAYHIDGPMLGKLGHDLLTLVSMDLSGRSEWDAMMADSLKFITQIVEPKNTPFSGASNVKFPLMTVAALNYHARAYPALIQGSELVVMRPSVSDPDGTKGETAARVASHMSYQLLEEQSHWEEDTDRALIVQPIMGCAFKKVRWDSRAGTVHSDLIYPEHLIVPYYTRHLADATRITHALEFTSNDIHERVENRLFLECDYKLIPPPPISAIEAQRRRIQGTQPSGTDDYQPQYAYEIHIGLDLDGDGYQEPYAVTVNSTTGHVYRIVAMYFDTDIKWSKRKDGRIASIDKVCPFIKYGFIPSPDGGFYDWGFWCLLMGVNAGVNTGINQLLDAATKQNSGGGFLGRGVKLAGGRTRVEIGEWVRAESSGPQLRDSIVPHVHPDPSDALMQLLQLLIGYGEKVGMSTEITSGENIGQNTPASTAGTMAEGGLNVFNGVYKRTWRAMAEEFRAIFHLNKIYLGTSQLFSDLVDGNVMDISIDDYRAAKGVVRPAADPHVATDSVRVSQSFAVAQLAAQDPGFDRYQANKRVLKSMKVPNIEEVLPDPKGPNAMPPPPPDPRIVAGELRAKTTILRVKVQAELKAHQLMQSAEMNRAKIALMEAQSVKTLAEAEATGDRTSLDALTLRMNALRDANEQVVKTAELIHELVNGMDEGEDGDGGIRPAIDLAGLGALAGTPSNGGPEDIPGSQGYGAPGVPLRGRPLQLEG